MRTVCLLSACVVLAAGGVARSRPEPPPHTEVAKFARYVVHDSSWTAMATMAAREPIMDFPFANIFSMSDGPIDSSTGVPYMYLMPLELSAIDLSHNEKASLTMTMAQVADVCMRLYISTDATLRASTARRTTTTSRTLAVLTSSSPAQSSL